MRMFFRFIIALTLSFLVGFHSSFAAEKKPSRASSLVVDVNKGLILHENSANSLRYPASLTKMMTIYLAFEAIESGKIKFSDMLHVSERAMRQPRSNLGLKANSKISVKNAVLSLIVKSANDSAVVIAEGISGSEKEFAKKMTKRARDLGMSNTTFMNASGLFHENQKTTAYDMAKLAIALKRDYPQYYKLFSQKSFVFQGRTYTSSNRVLKNYVHATGLKTGYISASGFNLVTSAKKGNTDLVGVVFGGRTAKERDWDMISMLNKQFKKIEVAAGKSKFSVRKKPNVRKKKK